MEGTALLETLPQIPGGWTRETIRPGGRELQFVRPADPDAILDDPQALKACDQPESSPYWFVLWPASRIMARLVAGFDWPGESRVLEIGCGVGLVGLAGLAAGLHVTFSDVEPRAIAVAAHNARINGLTSFDTLRVDWREPADAARFPVVLASDVLYDDCRHAPLLRTLNQVLETEGVCWIGDPGRRQLEKFVYRGQEAGFDVTVRDDELEPASLKLGEFRLLLLRRRR